MSSSQHDELDYVRSHLNRLTDISVWEDAHSKQAERIWRDTSVDGLHRFYLHCIYSADFVELVRSSLFKEGGVTHPLSDLLSRVREPALRAEQAARQRNLARHVVRACPRAAEYMGNDVLAAHLRRFSSTPFFWTECGRTLAEHFCVYMVLCGDYAEDVVLTDLLRLDGVISGIGNRRAARSPWTREQITPRNGAQTACEILSLQTRFFDPAGRLLDVVDLQAASDAELASSAWQLVEVALLNDGKIAAGLLAELKEA